MTDEKGKTPLQASGAGHANTKSGSTGTDHGRTQSESQGGAYPNPHQGKEEEGKGDKFHGGQSGTAYHGSGQLGDQDVKKDGNVNSATKDG